MTSIGRLASDELVVDSFAGGGGASAGLEWAVGRVDIAINHDPEALAMHAANHPTARHYREDITELDPRAVAGSRPVGILWASPDCTHFSRAKGAQPRAKGIRGLAWVVVRWAESVRPRFIFLENVEEFEQWGPLLDDGRPDPSQLGAEFRRWVSRLSDLGYRVEWRSMVAADYGTPTTRRRLFLVAHRDDGPIVWPEPTHGKGRTLPWRSAAVVIDWSLPCPSILDRKDRRRPLAEATMRRIAKGLRQYVLRSAKPFIVRHGHYSTVTGAGLREGAAFVTKFFGTSTGISLEQPLPTVTAGGGKGGGHLALVKALLRLGADQESQGSLFGDERLDGLVTIRGEAYQIVDVGMRMLTPRELFRAQGFPDTYRIDISHNGKPLTKTAQIRLAGNSVCPHVAAAIVSANVVGTVQESWTVHEARA